MPVHHINVDQVRARVLDFSDLFIKTAEISG
jgi:hypothetical protein